jgi:CelD/BcsL family acetyltransferase involved in cellulose biosynthesis
MRDDQLTIDKSKLALKKADAKEGIDAPERDAVSGVPGKETSTLIHSTSPKTSSTLNRHGMSLVVVGCLEDLMEHIPAWDDLAAATLEPNPFYESWMLIPGIRSFGAGKDIRFVLIFAQDPARPAGPRILCGFFPLERRRHYAEAPVRIVGLWKHKYCFLCVPLLRADYAEEAFETFFDWLAFDSWSGGIMEFKYISGEGKIDQLLADQINRRNRLSYTSERFTRALLRPSTDGDTYVRSVLSKKRRYELKRLSDRLSEKGGIEYAALGPDGNVAGWIEDFIRLEAAGWKGRDGGAIGANEATRAFFVSVATEAFRRGRLMMLGMKLDGRPIAQKCNFIAGNGSFAFKIAYDENYAPFSPGLQLEVENIHRLHERPDLHWMDSCAVTDHFMKNRIWKDRRMIQTVLVGTGKFPGEIIVSLLPLRRWLQQKLVNLKLIKSVPNF